MLLKVVSYPLPQTSTAVADPGEGGGPGGLDPPPFLCHDVGFLTLGPKLDPRLAPFFCFTPPPPPFKNPGSAPVQVPSQRGCRFIICARVPINPIKFTFLLLN